MRNIALPDSKDSKRLSRAAANIFDSFCITPNQAPAVLIGSAVSLWEPSSLPTGQNFTNALYDVILGGHIGLSTEEEDLLKKIFGYKKDSNGPKDSSKKILGFLELGKFSGMPFEHLMECCPSEEKANELINSIYSSRIPNNYHLALARGLESGLISSIVTTNYDCCIDEALDQSEFLYDKVVTENDAQRFLDSRDQSCYFKIHGSAEPTMKETPRFLLRHEGLLQPSKRQLLNLLTVDRPLIMIGYSGLDFELCPEIEKARIEKLIWNSFEAKPPSLSAKRLLERKNGILLYGDMFLIFNHWLGMKDSQPTKTPDLSNQVKHLVNSLFSDKDIFDWRLKILNSLGLPAYVFKVISKASTLYVGDYKTSIEKGRSHFHAGRYKYARRNFQKAIRQSIVPPRPEKIADAALEVSDAYRSFGAPIRAYLFTWLANISPIPDLRTKKLIKQALVVKDFIEIVRSLKKLLLCMTPVLKPLEISFDYAADGLEFVLKRKLIKCAQESLQIGNWIDFQQTSLIAEGLGIDISAMAEGDFYLPPSSGDGYSHLAYYIPQTMVFYDRFLKDPSIFEHDLEFQQEWRHHVWMCEKLGIDSSLWKILALSPSKEDKATAQNVYQLCQYGRLKRSFDWKKFAISGKQKTTKTELPPSY